jgi:hypothetical protein
MHSLVGYSPSSYKISRTFNLVFTKFPAPETAFLLGPKGPGG